MIKVRFVKTFVKIVVFFISLMYILMVKAVQFVCTAVGVGS